MISLEDIKTVRAQLGITQAELAYRAKVSQSLIAKIESGLLDPTYNNAKKIFDALDDLTKHKEIKAEEIMTKRIVSVGKESGVHEIIKKIKDLKRDDGLEGVEILHICIPYNDNLVKTVKKEIKDGDTVG